MTLRASSCHLLVALSLLNACCIYAQTGTPSARSAAQAAMDRDLLEVTVPQLEQLYRSHKYTVTQVESAGHGITLGGKNMSRAVTVSGGPSGLRQVISVGRHQLFADEPKASGGHDEGPDPYELRDNRVVESGLGPGDRPFQAREVAAWLRNAGDALLHLYWLESRPRR